MVEEEMVKFLTLLAVCQQINILPVTHPVVLNIR